MSVKEKNNGSVFGNDLVTVLAEIKLDYSNYQAVNLGSKILAIVGYKPSGQRSFVRHGVVSLLQSPDENQMLIISRSRRGSIDVRGVDLTTEPVQIFTAVDPDLKSWRLRPSIIVPR